jgi:phenylacetic acid degradation operon negative regulatory protein
MVGRFDTLAPGVGNDILAADHVAALRTLRCDLDALSDLPEDPLDAAAARMLLIHRWRRIVLRFPELAAPLLPSGWTVAPRAGVASAWHALTPRAEAWWDATGPGLPPMPAAEPALLTRFGGKGLD